MSLPVWRSLLFVPATAQKFIEKGPGVGADGLILDLEDSVAANAKEAARAAAPDIVRGFASAKASTRWCASTGPGGSRCATWRPSSSRSSPASCARWWTAPSMSWRSARRSPSWRPSAASRRGKCRLCVAVETAKGYLNLREIAHADPRSVSLSLGSEDFGLSMGMTADEETLYGLKQRVVACAREAGILPMGFVGSIAEFRDIEGFRRIVRRSKKMGLQGASCIHPNQVRVCNEEFGPTETEVDEARRVIEAYDEALARGEGAITVDGKMVDVPVAERAKAVLRIADAIAARQAR